MTPLCGYKHAAALRLLRAINISPLCGYKHSAALGYKHAAELRLLMATRCGFWRRDAAFNDAAVRLSTANMPPLCGC
ncbi:MAG: hypothetical protein JO360_09865 [Acidobacteria bacterium]|nr:hypothetical protein [Acidobacteriota bacterium]